MLTILSAIMQIPASGQAYDGRTDYVGPALVCGSAFSVRLREGEVAVLKKPSFIAAEYTFRLVDSAFSVRESMAKDVRGTVVRRLGDGTLRRTKAKAGYEWVFADNAPGATVISGDGVKARRPSAALKRVSFAPVRYNAVGAEPCAAGRGSERRTS